MPPVLKQNGAKKRVVDSDEDTESSESYSDKVKKRLTKKRRIQHEEPEEASEVEMVEDVELPEPETEEVDDNVNQLSDDQEVSINIYCYTSKNSQ